MFVGVYSEANKELAGEEEKKHAYLRPVIEALQTFFG